MRPLHELGEEACEAFGNITALLAELSPVYINIDLSEAGQAKVWIGRWHPDGSQETLFTGDIKVQLEDLRGIGSSSATRLLPR
jgi:hypothetical protein